MAKALFVPFAPSLAHVSRCLAVADAWRAKGHTATFAVGAERIGMVQDAGYKAHPLPEVPGQVFRADRGFRWLNREYFTQNLDQERVILADVRPDVVVFDFCFTAALSARLAGLPSASIVHGNALRLALRLRETARLLIGNPQHARGAVALRLRVMGWLFPVTFQLVMRAVARRFASVLEAQGLPPVNSPFELLLGDEILVADIPDLLPPGLPANCHVVGPLAWSGWSGSAPWLDTFDASPIVYVTMGSTVEARSGLVKIIEALRDASYHVVVSTGSLSLPAGLELPSHIHVFSTVPGAEVVRRSAIVFHHGGHGTLMQALAAGVPSLVLPANADQILVAQQVQALGVGRSLWQPTGLPMDTGTLDRMTPAQIRREVDDLIADGDCARVCKAFCQKIGAYHGAATAADIIEGIAASAFSS